MTDLWQKIKKSVVEGVTAAAEKTEEYTKIGKVKIDILNIKRKISKSFTELGGVTYEAIKGDTLGEALKTEKVHELITSIEKLESELESREADFAAMTGKEGADKAGECAPE